VAVVGVAAEQPGEVVVDAGRRVLTTVASSIAGPSSVTT